MYTKENVNNMKSETPQTHCYNKSLHKDKMHIRRNVFDVELIRKQRSEFHLC